MDEQEKKQSDDKEKVENQPPSSRLEELRRSRGRESWIVGAILIVLGVGFLMQNLTGFYLDNWWALFILIPAFSSFRRGWQAMQATDGQFSSFARRSFIGGLVLTVVAVILLFNLDWVIFGPILLIVAGAAMLISSVLPK